MKKRYGTKAIHSGEHPEWFNQAVTGDISPSTTYVIPNAKSLEGWDGYIYSRISNPTRKSLEEKIASLDDCESAVALSSGMAAVSVGLMSCLSAGDMIIAQKSLDGGTYDLVVNVLPKFGVETLFVPKEKLYDLSWAPKEAKVAYIETPSNPTLGITDIRATCTAAHGRGMLVVADNSFATSYLQKPASLGVDLVVYSATKFMAGHSDCLAGAITGRKDLVEKAYRLMTQFGSPLDPFACFLLARGLKTLELRMNKAQSTAMEIARFLANHPKVSRVFYPGLWNSPERELALTQMKGWGGMVTFEMKGGFEGASALFDNLQLIFRAGSLGGIESCISIPVLMSHHHLDEAALKEADITNGMLRLSVGIEDNSDLIEDLTQALDKVK